MATAVIMPRLGQFVESCILGKWYKQKGDPVKTGDLLFSYETDKAAFDETAKSDGVLLDVFFAEGDDVPCLAPVCAIGQAGEDIADLRPERMAKNEPDEKPAKPVKEAARPSAASPRAKNLAARSGADLSDVAGSGPNRRIITPDVQDRIRQGRMATRAAGSAGQGLAGSGLGGRVTVGDVQANAASLSTSESGMATTAIRHSRIRKTIARAMHASLAEMAQLTLQGSFDATDILALRSRLQDEGKEADVPTLNDIVLFAASRVLARHPTCNAHYDDEKLTLFSQVNLGVAVDTPRGLIVPTLFAADQLTLAEIGHQVRNLAEACRKGAISPDLTQGATFTVTNLGGLGVESFTPVINPPQTCVLGVCSLTTRVRETAGVLTAYQAMGLALTFDHRALDGAPAARFLQDLEQTLEHFSMLLVRGGLHHV